VKRRVRRDDSERAGGGLAEIGERHHAGHAGHLQRARGVDAHDARVSVRAAHDRGVQHAGKHDVPDVAAAALDEPRVFFAEEAIADEFHAGSVSKRRRLTNDVPTGRPHAGAELGKALAPQLSFYNWRPRHMRGWWSAFKLAALAMAVVMTIVSLPRGLAHAGLVETEQVIGESAASADRARVITFLLREDVREQMIRLGVRPDEAIARVAALSDAELQRIAGHLDTLPAGQFGPPEALIITAAVIFLILLILDIAGVTDIFPFIKKTKRR
jgi:hypothetical protein